MISKAQHRPGLIDPIDDGGSYQPNNNLAAQPAGSLQDEQPKPSSLAPQLAQAAYWLPLETSQPLKQLVACLQYAHPELAVSIEPA